MHIRLTIDVLPDDYQTDSAGVAVQAERYGVLIPDAERIPAKEFGKVVEQSIDRIRGYENPAPAPVRRSP